MTTSTTPPPQSERDEAIRVAVGRLDSPADIRVVGLVRIRDDYANLGFADMLDGLAGEASALAREAEIAVGTDNRYLARLARQSARSPITSTTTAGAAAEARQYRAIAGRCRDFKAVRSSTGGRPGAALPAGPAVPVTPAAPLVAPVVEANALPERLVLPGAAKANRHLPRRAAIAESTNALDDPAVLPGARQAARHLPRLAVVAEVADAVPDPAVIPGAVAANRNLPRR